jgi:hypothetical protein
MLQMRTAFAAVAALVLMGCSTADPGDPQVITSSDPVGACSAGEAFHETSTGLTNYVPGTSDSLPFLLTCMTPGPLGTMVTFVLPRVTTGVPTPGTYQVSRPVQGVTAAREAWAEVHLTVGTPAHYLGAGGRIHISASADGIVAGSYELALDRAPETDPRYPHQTAIRGAFRAPRLQDDGSRP